MRAAALIVATSIALVAAAASGAAPAPSAAAYWFVRPDLRMCPSPLCGGGWVRRVNQGSTRCADGQMRHECYVASTPGIPGKAWSGRAGTVLGRGALGPARIDGFPGLGMLSVTAAWRPAGARPPRGVTYRVRDNGTRCVTTPCFSLTATALGTGRARTLSTLDLDPVGAAGADLGGVSRTLAGQGALVTGTIVAVPDAGPAGTGRALRATQLWVRP